MMFDHVLQALPPQVVMHGSELIWQRPSDKYDVLKAALIYRFSDSESRHFEQVIHHLELDDSKPSHLLRQIQQIFGGESANNPRIICHVFLSRLPHQACCVFAAHTNLELTQLAAMADVVWKPTWLCRHVDSLQLQFTDHMKWLHSNFFVLSQTATLTIPSYYHSLLPFVLPPCFVSPAM